MFPSFWTTAIICEKARDTFATFLFSGSKSELPPAFVDTFVPNSIAEAVKDTKQELSMKVLISIVVDG